MKITIMIKFILSLLISLATLVSAYATPSDVNRAKRAISDIMRSEKSLAQAVKKLSQDERKALKRSTRGTDSDGDGVADILENSLGAKKCDADTDDDGVDDNDDIDEDKADSDDDGVPDGMEVETKGRISSFNDPVLVVGATTLKITPSTVFFRGLTSKADLIAGTCIEAEGRRSGAEILVDKIKRKKDSGCSGSDD
jgi:hypothetical protein